MPGPMRTCIGCRRVRPKKELARLVRGRDGRVIVDEGRRAPGRGAYVCREAVCADRALRAGRLGHAFKRPSEPPAVGAEAILWGPGVEHEAVNDKVRR
jgi:hypothetical protein